MSCILDMERMSRPWNLPANYDGRIEAECLYFGEGGSAFEVAVAHDPTGSPSVTDTRNLWQKRWANRSAPVLLLINYRDNLGNTKASLCGLSEYQPFLYEGVEPSLVSPILDRALEMDRFRAEDFVKAEFEKIFNGNGPSPDPDGHQLGFHNNGLVADHIMDRATNSEENREFWKQQTETLDTKSPNNLIKSLGFTITQLPNRLSLLSAPDSALDMESVAVAVFLHEDEDFDRPLPAFLNATPVASAMEAADKTDGLDYVIISRGSVVRLYMASMERKYHWVGRERTFIEFNLDLLSKTNHFLLPMMLSPSALRIDDESKGKDKTINVTKLIEETARYAIIITNRLRTKVHQEILPGLADVVAEYFDPHSDDHRQQLDRLYQKALTILYRLIFIAVTEDQDLLPGQWNEEYRNISLHQLAQDFVAESRPDFQPSVDQADNSSGTENLWARLLRLWDVLDKGDESLGVPYFIGGLFSSRPEQIGYGREDNLGGEIARWQIPDNLIRPVLESLLIDEIRPGVFGVIDYRQLAASEFGTIYETLLEWELMWADTDMTQNRDGLFLPAGPEDQVVKEEGDIYISPKTEDKGNFTTYATPAFMVSHLLNEALEPAITQHLTKVKTLLDKDKIAEANNSFFDFRVADICMGSGHFLTAALERITIRFEHFLQQNQEEMEGVEDRRNQLLSQAAQLLGEQWTDHYEISRKDLLRRLVARHCLYGVDVSRLAVDLSRFAIWLKTFVPGLPLPYLGHNLVTGDALVGIGTVHEAQKVLRDTRIHSDQDISQIESWMKRKLESIQQLEQLNDTDFREIELAKQAVRDATGGLHNQNLKGLFDILMMQRLGRYPDLNNLSGKGIYDYTETHPVQKETERFKPVHFPLAFPEVFSGDREGFDCIVGNPPWSVLKLNPNKWWRDRFGSLHKYRVSSGDLTRAIQAMRERYPELANQFDHAQDDINSLQILYEHSEFCGSITGDIDLFMVFAWRYLQITRHDGGWFGANLKYDYFFGPQSQHWREKVLELGIFADVTRLRNTNRWIKKDADPRFLPNLTSIALGGSPDLLTKVSGPFFTLDELNTSYRPETELESPAQVSKAELRKWSPDRIIPWLRNRHYKQIIDKIFVHPALTSDRHTWVVAITEDRIRTSTDHKLIKDPDDTTGLWPVYRSKSIRLWQPDTGDYQGWFNTQLGIDQLYRYRRDSVVSPASSYYRKPISDRGELPCFYPRIAFTKERRRKNRRTLETALVPANRFCGKYLPHLFFRDGGVRDEAYLLGIMSSLAADFYTDHMIDWYINKTFIETLPIPVRPPSDPTRRRVEVLVAGLVGQDIDQPGYRNWVELVLGDEELPEDLDREDAIAELNALAALLYGLNRDDLEYLHRHVTEQTIFEPFDPTSALEHFDRLVSQSLVRA